ncbi:putative transposase [Photorhabdus temperata subsp. temperata M1021]|nr:putative transposase [Photorhabdus temperata subsp. temperata M1021]
MRFSLCIGVTGSHVPHKSLDRLHAAFMPDAAQAVNRLPPALIPQERLHCGFDIIYTLSTHHQRFTFVRLFDPYLIGSRARPFPISLTTTSLKRSSSGGFGACACTPTPEGPPPSLVKHGAHRG